MWNCKSNELVGFSIQPSDLMTLDDVYEHIKTDEVIGDDEGRYILQVLWRDQTSVYDVIGPYSVWNSSPTSAQVEMPHALKPSKRACAE